MLTNASFLVVYASRHGHTRRVALQIADELGERGVPVDAVAVEQSSERDPGRYSAVVLAAPVYRERQSRAAVTWLARHRAVLSTRPLALVSVSLAAAGSDPESRATASRYVQELAAAGHAAPALAVPVAGALEYERYAGLTRRTMKRTARAQGLSTDTSRNHDYTDWAALHEVVLRLLALVDVSPVEAAARA